jgi:Tetratricopeptide repeat.
VIANGSLGDALMEQGKTDEAIKYYLKAAEVEQDLLYAPMYMERAAIAYQVNNKNEEALKIYKKLREKFPTSQQAQTAIQNMAMLGEINP